MAHPHSSLMDGREGTHVQNGRSMLAYLRTPLDDRTHDAQSAPLDGPSPVTTFLLNQLAQLIGAQSRDTLGDNVVTDRVDRKLVEPTDKVR